MDARQFGRATQDEDVIPVHYLDVVLRHDNQHERFVFHVAVQRREYVQIVCFYTDKV